MTVTDTYRRLAHLTSPTVFQGRAGSAYVGILGILFDLEADGYRQALRGAFINDTDVGPAYDAPELIGEGDIGITRYPSESWIAYAERVRNVWDDAQTWGVNIVPQMAAAGYSGAVLKYHDDWPLEATADYWSEFWVWFPYGTHSVVSAEPQIVQTETGEFITYSAEGLQLPDVRTLRAIVGQYKPGHWICRSVKFEWNPQVNTSLLSWSGDDQGNIVESGGAVTDVGLYTQASAPLQPTWSDPDVVADGTEYLSTANAGLLAGFNDSLNTIAWYGERSGTGSEQVVFGFADSGGSAIAVGYDSSDKLFVERNAVRVTADTADDGNPHSVVVTLDGSAGSIYVDGTLIKAGTVDATTLTLTGAEMFADGAASNLYDGMLRRFALYSQRLSSTQIVHLSDWVADPTDTRNMPSLQVHGA